MVQTCQGAVLKLQNIYVCVPYMRSRLSRVCQNLMHIDAADLLLLCAAR